jgi:hypothetical protein
MCERRREGRREEGGTREEGGEGRRRETNIQYLPSLDLSLLPRPGEGTEEGRERGGEARCYVGRRGHQSFIACFGASEYKLRKGKGGKGRRQEGTKAERGKGKFEVLNSFFSSTAMFTRDLGTGYDEYDAPITDAQKIIYAFNPDTEELKYHGPTRQSGVTIDWISDCTSGGRKGAEEGGMRVRRERMEARGIFNPPDDMSETNYGLVIGLPVGLGILFVVILLLALIFVLRKRKLDLTPLPPDVRWQYEQFQGFIFFCPPCSIPLFKISTAWFLISPQF